MPKPSHDDVTVDDIAHAHRWGALIHQAHPTVPEGVLRVYYESMADPTTADLTEAVGGDEAHAEGWKRWLEASLLSPGYYGELFAAEDALTLVRDQHQRYLEDVRATRTRLTELQREMEATLAYSHIGQAQALEVKERLEALDLERVTLLRHQSDLPGAGAIIEAALTTAQTALDEAQHRLQATRLAALEDVEDRWLQEGLALLPSVLTLLGHAKALDVAWYGLGVEPSRERGSGRLREALSAALRSA